MDLESLMVYFKIQSQSFLGSGEEDFFVFLPYMGMAAILFNATEPFEQTVNILSTEGTIKKSGENCLSNFTES